MATLRLEDLPELLLPSEVGKLIRADPKTVTRWAKAGKLPKWATARTMGGHWRFRRAWVYRHAKGLPIPDEEPDDST